MMDEHREAIKTLTSLIQLNKNNEVPKIKENIKLYTDDTFIVYWKELIFKVPTRIKIILELVNEGVFESKFLMKVLELHQPNIFQYLLEREEFSKVLTLLRYLVYDHFMGYGIFKDLYINIKDTLKSINLKPDFFGFVESDSIYDGNEVKLNEYPNHTLLLKYLSQYSSDLGIIVTETCNSLVNYSNELYLEFDSFFDSEEVLIKEISQAQGIYVLIKVKLLYFLVMEDMKNLNIVLQNSDNSEFLALFIENLLSGKIPQSEECMIVLTEYLKNNPSKMEIAAEMIPFTEIDQKIFFELFGVSRPQYKTYTETENDLKKFVKELKFIEIQQMTDTVFLKEFFEVVAPSISHALVYTEKLKDILITRLRDENFQKEFLSGLTTVAGERTTYLNLITNKMAKAGILQVK